MLYQVFLHELGHLQIINEKARSVRGKFARESKAQAFADLWCRRLWSKHFEHIDPAHNKPTAAELADPTPELTDLQRRAQQFPNDAQLHQELGKLCSKLKQPHAAKEAYQKSLALNPRDPWTNLYLGNHYLSEENYPEAGVLFRRAVELLPDRSIGYWLLGQLSERLSEWEIADSYFVRGVEVEPTNKSARERLKRFRERYKQRESTGR